MTFNLSKMLLVCFYWTWMGLFLCMLKNHFQQYFSYFNCKWFLVMSKLTNLLILKISTDYISLLVIRKEKTSPRSNHIVSTNLWSESNKTYLVCSMLLSCVPLPVQVKTNKGHTIHLHMKKEKSDLELICKKSALYRFSS